MKCFRVPCMFFQKECTKVSICGRKMVNREKYGLSRKYVEQTSKKCACNPHNRRRSGNMHVRREQIASQETLNRITFMQLCSGLHYRTCGDLVIQQSGGPVPPRFAKGLAHQTSHTVQARGLSDNVTYSQETQCAEVVGKGFCWCWMDGTSSQLNCKGKILSSQTQSRTKSYQIPLLW